MPSNVAAIFNGDAFSSPVSMLAAITVRNGVVALRIDARPAPITVYPRKISEKGMALFKRPKPRNGEEWQEWNSTESYPLAACGEVEMQSERCDQNAEEYQPERRNLLNCDACKEEGTAQKDAEQEQHRRYARRYRADGLLRERISHVGLHPRDLASGVRFRHPKPVIPSAGWRAW
jgi:hypothetical protein